MVDGMKRGEHETFDGAAHSPLPELIERYGKEHRLFVPQAEMKVDCGRHLRIKRVAPPLPVATSDQCRHMVVTAVPRCFDRSVTYRLKRGLCNINLFFLTEEIEV